MDYNSMAAQLGDEKEPRTNPYDDIIRQQKDDTHAQAALTVGLSADKDPKREAENLTIARKMGTLPDVVAAYPADFRQRMATQYAHDILTDAPKLQAHINDDPVSAAVSKDDLHNLSGIERTFAQRAARQVAGPFRALAAGALTDFNAAAWGMAETGAGLVGADAAKAYFSGLRKSQEATGKAIQGDYGSDGFTEGGVASGFRSLGAMFPGLAASIVTGNPQFALGIGSGEAGGQAMAKAHDAGVSSARALTYGIEDAGAEYLTEMLPLGLLLKDIKAGSSFTKLMGHQLATEVPGEVTATAWQNANEWLNLHPEKSMDDYLKELGPDEGQTIIATVVQTLATGGLAHGAMKLQRKSDEKQAKIEQAAQDFNTLQTASEHAKASQTRDLAPDDFKQFVNSVTEDGHLANVYVNGEVFAQSMQAAGIGMEELQKTMPEVASQLQEAIQTQGDVNISTADYLTHIAASKMGDTLLQHLKVTPDGMTKAEADAQQQTQAQDMADEAGKEIKDISERAAFDNSKKAVYDQILAQHTEAGRFSPEANKINAKIYSEMIGTLAQDHGVTPEEFHAQHGQTLVGAGSGTFEQVLPDFMPPGMEKGDGVKLSAMYRGEDETRAVLLGQAASRLVADGAKENAHLGTFSHSADQSALNHIRKNHGDSAVESARGQLPITDSDIGRITDIIENYDGVRFDLLSDTGKPAIAYVKKTDDGVLLYVEEVHNKRHDLAALSMRKYPATADVQKVLQNASPNVRNDDGHAPSIGKPPQESKPPNGTEAKTPIGDTQTVEVGGVDRPALNSNGKPIHPTVEGVRNFWRWFGDSRVVDDQGRPLVVYHGTSAKFNTFKEGESNGWSVSRQGFYFTDAKNVAEEFGNLVDTYLSATNPLDLRDARPSHEAFWLVYDELTPEYQARIEAVDLRNKVYGAVVHGLTQTPEFIAAAKSAGFDGLIFPDQLGGAETFDSFVAFEPAQIKSATGNNGDFNGQDANILHQNNEANRGFFAPDSRTIGLLKDADLSTYIHETGHWALDTYAKLASQPDAPVKIKEDMGKLLHWFGVESLEKWNSMTLEEQRPHHEQLARGFEAYFMEGKAPNLELQSAFSRIKSWMLSIYKSLRSLNVELTPEVRQVFDRMLASEDAIKEAEAARGYFMPETKPAGVSDVAWQELQDLHDAATSEATDEMQARSLRDMKWGSNAKSKMIRKLQKEARELRREVRIDARRDIMTKPIYMAMAFLKRPVEAMTVEKRSVTVDNSVDTLFEAIAKLGGMDREAVLAEWGASHKDAPGSLFGKPVLRKTNGRSIGDMATALAEEGYLSTDEHGKYDMHEFEDAFADEMGGSPRYSAYADPAKLQGPEQLTPSDIAHLDAGRLNTEMMKAAMLGEPVVLDRLEKLRVSRPDGIDPDLIADRFRYESAEGFLQDLANAEPMASAIEGLTDRYMLERHGDLIDARAIEQAANEAIHNELRAKFMATGLKMLSKSPISARTIQKGAKEAADAAVSAKLVRNLKPKQYEAAEARANREALKLVATDPAGAVRAQRSAVLNNALVKSTNEALTDVEKLVAYGKRLEKDAAQKNMRGETLAQMNALLGRFDLRVSVTQPDTNRKPIGQWVQDEAERLSAVTPEIPEWVANESYRTHYRELTVGQIRDLRDTLKQLEFLARREHKQYAAIRAMDFADERGAVLAEIRRHWPGEFDEAGDVLGIEPKFAPQFADAVSKLGNKFAGEFLSPETIITILGGGKFSTVNESLFGRISKRADWKATKLGELYQELKPYYAKYSLQEKVEFARKDIGTAKIGLAITREKAMGVALLHGHVEGRERLRNYGWGEQQQLAIINLLEDRDLDLVEKMWQIQDEMIWPELEALNKRTRGKSPPKVEAVAYTVHVGLLHDRVMKGGYSRLKYDGDLDEVAFNHDRLDGIKALVGGTFGKSAKTNQGTSTERKQNVTQRPRLDLGVFAGALNESVHDLAYREAVADTMRMLRDKGIMAATKRVVGNEGYRALVNRVEEIATPPMNPSGFVEKAIGIARKNTVVNLMSGVKTALQNFTGLTPALAELNAGTFGAELAKFYGPKMMERYQFCMDQSEFMRNRFTSFDRDLQKTAGRMTLNGSYLPDTSTFLALMGFVDKGVSVPVWNAAFKQGMERFENDTSKAVDYADHVVRQTQGSGREADLAQVMSGHGGWGALKKAFTMFYSYFNGQLGLLVKHGVIAKLEAKQNPQLATARYTAKFIAIVVLPTILTELLMHGNGPDGEDDDEMLMRYASAFVKYGAGFFPFVRDIVPGIWTKVVNPSDHYFGVKISPIDSAGEGIVEGIKSLKDVATGENDEKDTKHLIMAAGYTLGLPGKLVADTVDGTRAWLSGDAGPQAVVLGPPKK